MASKDAQVVVVTGASAGVGRAIVRRFADEGASIALIARGRERLEAAAGEVEAAGGRALVLPLDVADAEALDQAHGRFDDRSKPRSLQLWATTHRSWLIGGAVAAAALAWRSRD